MAVICLAGIGQAQAGTVNPARDAAEIPDRFKDMLPAIGSLRGKNGKCTAFCVARDVVATSRHCVHEVDERWLSSKLKFQFVVERNRRLHKSDVFGATLQERRVNIALGLKMTGFVGGVRRRNARIAKTDWALIRLQRPICESVLPVEPLIGLASRTMPGRGHAAMLSAEKFSRRSPGNRWTFSGDCRFVTIGRGLGEGSVAHDCPSAPGRSGSPILIQDDTKNPVVVAINAGSNSVKRGASRKSPRVMRATRTTAFADALPHFLAHPRISDGEKLKQLQAGLISRHYLKGEANGVFGSDTRLAIVRFEHSVGLPELGLPSTLVFDLVTGRRQIPRPCLRFSNVVSTKCKTFGLP